MRVILQNVVYFKGKTVSYNAGSHKITDYFDNNGVLSKKTEADEFERIIDTKWFDSKGEIIEHLHKDYYEMQGEKGYIEHYKGAYQEYTRKAYTKIENGLKHHIDKFISKTSPTSSYINEFIYDLQSKLIDVITKKI